MSITEKSHAAEGAANPEHGPSSQRFDYRDARGKVMCSVEMGLGRIRPIDSPDERLGTYEGRELTGVNFFDSKGNKFDLFEIVGRPDDTVIVDSLVEQCGHIEERNVILIPPLHSPIELEWLLHEPRHHQQERLPGWRDLLAAYEETPAKNRLFPYNKIRNKAAAIFAAIPAIKEAVGPVLAQLEELESRIIANPTESDKLAETQEQLRERFKLDNIFLLPRQLTERDAERTAIAKLGAIAQATGVDLRRASFTRLAPALTETPHLEALRLTYRGSQQGFADADVFSDPRVHGGALNHITSIRAEVKRYLSSIAGFGQSAMPWGGDGNYDLEDFLKSKS